MRSVEGGGQLALGHRLRGIGVAMVLDARPIPAGVEVQLRAVRAPAVVGGRPVRMSALNSIPWFGTRVIVTPSTLAGAAGTAAMGAVGDAAVGGVVAMATESAVERAGEDARASWFCNLRRRTAKLIEAKRWNRS